MALKFDISGSQIDGARDYQEDAFLVTHLSGDKGGGAGSLVVVADGMGGHAAGNVASNMAVQAFNKHVTANYPNEKLHETLAESVQQANNSITETVRETPALKGMGCTLVCCVLEDKYLRWVSVGDSHLYLFRNKEITKKNADHSYGGFLDRMAAEGTPIEPEEGFSRNMLMSALTGDEIADVDCPETPLEVISGDRIIICSDGLDTLSEGKIVYFCDSSETPKECVDALLKGVEEENAPRQDNTTVVVIDVSEEVVLAEPAPPPAPEPQADFALELEPDSGPPTEPQGEKAAEPAPPPAQVEQTEQPSGQAAKSKTGLIIGAVAALVVIAAGVGFFLSSSGPEEKLVVEDEPADVFEADGPNTTDDVVDVEPPPQPPAGGAVQPTERPPAVAAATGPFKDPLKGGAIGPEMVWIPAGSFKMGSDRGRAEPDERPVHGVRVERFAMSRYEITIAEYERFARAAKRPVPKDTGLNKQTHPATFVTWEDALRYTSWLSKQTGAKYRLPSEAEWEYATRGGSRDHYWWGRKGGGGHAHCAFGCDSRFDSRSPTEVGSFKPNGYGLYDTAGNVAEWVRDCYHVNYRDAPDSADAWETGDCSVRVIRGGSYAGSDRSLRSANREVFQPGGSNDEIGIRVVREP